MRTPILVMAAILAVLGSANEVAAQCGPASELRIIPSGEIYSYDLGAFASTASEIRIEESLWSDFHTLVRSTTWTKASGKPLPTFVHFSAAYHLLFYRVSAFNADDPNFRGCTWTGRVVFFEDAGASRLFRRTIVPVAGSLAGANGSRFRTSVVLLNPFNDALSGRVVFHAVGTSGTAGDPSIHYQLGGGQHVEYEDVVAAIGVSGLGSLDIIPDPESLSYVPAAQVTIFNDAGNGATFGMSVPQIRAGDIQANANPFDFVVPNRGVQRLNVGVRSGGEGGSIQATVRSADGSTRRVRREFPPDSLVHTTIENLLGIPAADGDSVRILTNNVVVYATLTNNVTNDPFMLVSFANAPDLDVGYFW